LPTKAPNEKEMVGLKKNIEILMGYSIGNDGKLVSIGSIEESGFKFDNFTSYFLSADDNKKFFYEYGPFIINRETKRELFIRIKNQKNELHDKH